MKKTHLLVLSAVLLTVFLPVAGQNQQQYVFIVGRVVDSEGHPVENAEITYEPDPEADMQYTTKSGPDGKFQFRTGSTSDQGTIWITSKPDLEDWGTLIRPGAGLDLKYLNGHKPIKLRDADPPSKIDLGDVQVQMYYAPIKIIVSEKWKDEISGPDETISFRITDEDEEVASVVGVGPGFVLKESSITIALPLGVWTVEIRTEYVKWKVVAESLRIVDQKPIVLYMD